MVSDTIKKPYAATPEGERQLLECLGSLAHFVSDDPDSLVMVCADNHCAQLAPCPLHGPSVLGIVVTEPDRFYLADRLAAVVNGHRLGYGPGQAGE